MVLTAAGLEHRYVANRLCLAVPVEAVLVDDTLRRQSLRRAFRGGIRRGLSRLARELFRRAVRDPAARDTALRNVLGEELTEGFVAEARVITVPGVNSADAVVTMAELEPDAILVYGTSIVGGEMLGQARELALNMHTGMSPHYRGTDCEFWPLVNGEPELIGATVHECTADVDGGQIFAVEPAAYEDGDGVHEIFARAVAAGADLYVDVARRYLAGELTGVPQDLSIGREYRGYMRTLLPELRARRALRCGVLRDAPKAASASAPAARAADELGQIAP